MNQVVLIVPPFFMGGKPSLATSLLKSVINEANISCTIIYANLLFKQMIDPQFYEDLSVLAYHNDIVEFVFASDAFPDLLSQHEIFAEKLQSTDNTLYNKLLSSRESTRALLTKVIKLVTQHQPKIVWLYSFVKQMTASISLANAIKKYDPNIITCLGGHSCNQPIARELANIAPSIDYIFNGEPEIQFKNFCINRLTDQTSLIQNYPDTVIDCLPVNDLDDLPFPDFIDYFEQTNKMWQFTRHIGLETSRGCFMGEQSLCIFCGHHTKSGVTYRKKSPGRALKELHYLTSTYNPDKIYAKDSALPMDYPENVFAHFQKPLNLKNIFYEVSPQLTFDQLKIMKEKGVNSLQPGIESLNDRLLTTLQKKTTTFNNIRFLRDCRALEIYPIWNFLYTVPGETKKDYNQMAVIIPALVHLQPPHTIRPIFIMRYSPLYEKAHSFELTNITPVESYTHIFPQKANITDLSLLFTADYDIVYEPGKLSGPIDTALQNWQSFWENKKTQPRLELIRKKKAGFISDTRSISQQTETQIEQSHIALLNFLKLPTTKRKLNDFIKQKKMEKQFKFILNKQWILEQNETYISLVVNRSKYL